MRKFNTIFFILVLLVIILSGSCSDQKSVTTITWWGFPTFGQDGSFEKELINAFEQENPNIKINFEMISFENGPAKISAALASKTGPDITYDAPGRIISWGNRGLLASLDDIIYPVLDTLAIAPLEASKGEDGSYYMYPIHSGGFMMGFNKSLLEDLDLLDMLPYERDKRQWTLKEYESLLRALKDALPAGKVPAVFYAKSTAGDQGTRAFMVNLHGNAPLMNENLTKYTFNNANAVKNAEWVQMAVNEGLLLNGASLQSGDAINMYSASNAASTILFSLQLEKINKDKINYNGEYFETIYMPYPNNVQEPILEFIVGGPAVFDNGDKEKIDAAKLFIQFMATDPVYAPMLVEATGMFPVSSTIDGSFDSVEKQWNAEAIDFFGSYYNSIISFSDMRNAWYPAMQNILNGKDAKETLDMFVEEANKDNK